MKPLSVVIIGIAQFVWNFRPAASSEMFNIQRNVDDYGFVVVTEDGTFHGFDSCGDPWWTSSLGRNLINATDSGEQGTIVSPRMVPAIDGSLYVVFPPDLANNKVRIAHVNATIMSVVAESPFSTPAFPNTYLTGSKMQSLHVLSFNESFGGWIGSGRFSNLLGKKLMFSINDWTLHSIDVFSQTQLWSVSFTEFPPLTQSHLMSGSLEQVQIQSFGRDVEIETSATSNKIILRKRPLVCSESGRLELEFTSQVLGVYMLLSPADTRGNLAMVLVSKNAPIPTNFGGIPEGIFFNQLASQSVSTLPGVRVEYSNNFEALIGEPSAFPLAIRPRTYEVMPWHLERSEVIKKQVLSEYRVIDFLTHKFSSLPPLMKIYVVLVSVLALYLLRRLYRVISFRLKSSTKKGQNSPSISILLPDGTALRQTLPPEGSATISISSPTSTSSGARLVLIPSEAIQPYEVVKVGQSDSVEFSAWQNGTDIEIFDKKIKDISQRTAKLPFAHSAASRRPSLETGNATVLFLGRNVDEPKLVFRNPRAESEIQHPNVPVYTQSIRNAVASSALKESPNLRAYIPRSVCGSWNTFEGIFQEYVPKPRTAATTVSAQSFREYPESAVDTALLVMLLRDTDAHDGNYTRDLRRKIALFDLGCALADKPLPNDPVDRLALDNFEIWKRVPYLLNVPFEQRHVEYIESIDFFCLKNMWAHFEYQEQLVDAARLANSRLVHPTVMLRILEMHAKFILACASAGKTVLFAAEVLYSGMYDDLWIEVGELNIEELERRLLEIAKEKSQEAVFPYLEKIAEPPQPDGEMENFH